MDQVEEIKSKVDVVQLVGEYVQLKKAGRNFKGLCPWHGEKTPSFMVNPELQIYKCFGCGLGGDAYSFVQKMEGVEFGEALKILAERVGVKLVGYKKSGSEENRETLLKINALAADYYHYLLTKHELGKGALEYVRQRGLSDEAIKLFRLGFAPEGWDFLKRYLTDKKNFDLTDLQRVGLVVEGKNYDRFRNRVMFPLANSRGQIVGFAGRVLPPAAEQAKYVNTPETELYRKGELLYGLDVTKNDIRAAGAAVVVEGEIDMIASWQSGVKNVAAIKGSALTQKQVELLKRYCDTIILALDADAAGDTAARRGIEIAQKAGLFVKIANGKLLIANGKYKDAGEVAIENPGLWKQAVGEAIPIWDFYIESAVERFGLDTQGRTRIGKEVVPILAMIEDEILKAEYVKKLAEVLGVREEDVRGQMAKTLNSKFEILDKIQIQNPNDQKKTRREVVEEYLVGLAAASNRVDKLGEIGEWVRTRFWARVVEELQKKPDVKKLPAELRERVEEAVMKQGEWEEVEKWEGEWVKAAGELEAMEIRERIGGRVEPEEVVRLTRRLGELTKGR